mgnify:FL=1
MKRLITLLFVFVFISCEKVIDLDLEFEDQRIVIEAKINKKVNSNDGFAEVLISETSSYFDNEIKFIEDAEVSITEVETGQSFDLKFDNNKYFLKIDKISLSSEYELNIFHNNNHYQSIEKINPSTNIKSIERGTRDSLDEDEIEIVTTIDDQFGYENYYLFEYAKGNLQPVSDEYFDGNTFSFSYFINKNKIENNSLDIVLEGIDEEYFKYIIQIVVQTNTQNGPFSAAPSSIKGNIYCVNNSELKPFGYFKVSEYDSFRLENIVID